MQRLRLPKDEVASIHELPRANILGHPASGVANSRKLRSNLRDSRPHSRNCAAIFSPSIRSLSHSTNVFSYYAARGRAEGP
jgi:hypothetical protein